MDEAKSCSGGRHDERDRCFSARLMWRANGAGEFYNYLPMSGTQGNGYCETAPMSKCDANFGDSSEFTVLVLSSLCFFPLPHSCPIIHAGHIV